MNKDVIVQAQQRAESNGKSADNLEDYLKWLHLGELVDCIRSKWFYELKDNEIKGIECSKLINLRNDIMHTRHITDEEFNFIKEKGREILRALNETYLEIKWNKFLEEEIADYKITDIYIQYPLGRNFEKLIGRDEDLKQIKSELNIPFPLSIVGTGGIGKTALIQQLIEDVAYLPEKPYERIFFLSFKDSVFENGKVNRFKKVIKNHQDLIENLAIYLGIDEEDFEEKGKKVWSEIFAVSSLVILDNLETEIVRSNLIEFTNIADMFMRNYTSPSRLIITSRFGLGDRERKYPLNHFNIEQTKELVIDRVGKKKISKMHIQNKEWEWVQKYGQGNPGLIIAFSNILKSGNRSISDLMILYQSNHSYEGKQLNSIREAFLDFCFENTIDGLSKNTQVYIAIVAKFAFETGIYEINNEILNYIVSELKLDSRLGETNIETTMLQNISFLQRANMDEYTLNELQILFLAKTASDKIVGIGKLKEIQWFEEIEQIIKNVRDMTYDVKLSTKQLLARIYKLKFRETGEAKYHFEAFMCEPTIENLNQYYSDVRPEEILNRFTLLDKCKNDLKNNNKVREQQKLIRTVLSALNETRELIKNSDIKDIRQSDLLGYFNQLRESLQFDKREVLTTGHRLQICKFLNSLGQEDESEKYLVENNEEMYNMAFVIYSKKFGNLVGKDMHNCKFYIDKCEELKTKVKLTVGMDSRYKINLARYYLKSNPQRAFENARYLDSVSQENDSIYSIYLESLLIRAECIMRQEADIQKAKCFITSYEKERKQSRYNRLYPSKKASLQSKYDFIMSYIRKEKKIS